MKGEAMSRLIKAHTYIPVSAEAFFLPVPIKLELYYRNTLLCVYSIDENLTVDYTYNANTEIPILTCIDRRLTIKDIYFLIRSRLLPENPYTARMYCNKLGLTAYDPWSVIEHTHGFLPMSDYWIKKGGEEITFNEVVNQYFALGI